MSEIVKLFYAVKCACGSIKEALHEAVREVNLKRKCALNGETTCYAAINANDNVNT